MRPHYMRLAGYEHVEARGDGCHVLRDIRTGQLEEWVSCNDPLGIRYKNTRLRFRRLL